MSNHTNENLLLAKLKESNSKITIGQIYYHYRTPTNYYKVLYIGLDEATEKVVIIYQAQYGNQLVWVRDIAKWCDEVEYNGSTIPRFILASDLHNCK